MLKLPIFAAATALLLAAAMPAAAVDGVILIDQNKALAGNLTPGDAAGFPVSITRSGSYRLTSDLVVADANTTAIEVTATAGTVTIDLNGFAISGPVVCVGSSAANPPTSCSPATSDPANLFGPGTGIRSLADIAIVVRNGTIRGMGRHGVFITGSQARLEGMVVVGNGASGLWGGVAAIIDNTVEGNLGDGIVFNQGMVRGNNVRRNGGHGIASTGIGGLISGNNVYRNAGAGLSGLNNSPYSLNNLDNNFGGFVSPAGSGFNAGHNGCNGGACP